MSNSDQKNNFRRSSTAYTPKVSRIHHTATTTQQLSEELGEILKFSNIHFDFDLEN
jgi:Asp-tRNA(Asn)/Glu-tRNA(Gln) amidotransferase C subunit